MAAAVVKDIQAQVVEWVMSFRMRPLDAAVSWYNWEEGDLAESKGPDEWQKQALALLQQSLMEGNEVHRLGVRSGHGVGKTALIAMLIHWFVSTRPNPQVVVTANTKNQLETKTWRELAVWKGRVINGDWFEWSATRYRMKGREDTWYASAIPWSKHKAQAFAGTHAKHVLIIFDEACHDDQTEVLTESGWKLFRDVGREERLLTMDPETGEAEYRQPRALIEMDYVGPMHVHRRRGSDFKVTPRHRMLHATPSGPNLGPWRMTEIKNLSRCQHRLPRAVQWQGEEVEAFTIPEYRSARKAFPERTVPMDVWLEFLGWYLSEGHLAGYASGEQHTVGITNRDVSRPAELLQKMGYDPRIYECSTRQVRVGSIQLAQTLARYGKGALSKRVPRFIAGLSPRQIRIFLDAYTEGDGYWKGGRMVIYTSSKKMADGLHELMLKALGSASVSRREMAGQKAAFSTHDAVSSVDGWVVRQTSGDYIGLKPDSIEIEQYAGKVYCADIPPHHTLLTRRNGQVLWSGNSEVDPMIWETAEGALTTPGSMMIAFGNPSQTTGKFADIWGKLRHRWMRMRVDSRTAKMANQRLIQEWIEDYGEDSDFVRVRVKGLPPKHGAKSLVSRADVDAAMARHIEVRDVNPAAPLLMGVDVARDGTDDCCILLRKGPKVHREIRVFKERDLMRTAGIVAEWINRWHPDVCFVDEVGMGAGVLDRLIQIGHDCVVGVKAGEKADKDKTYYNRRTEMWHRMALWMPNADLPDHKDCKDAERLRDELTAPEFYYDAKELMRLESKKEMEMRGIESPDIGDALALTFAYAVPSAQSDESSVTEPDVI